MRTLTNCTHQTKRDFGGFSRMVQLPVHHTRLWPICAHCLEIEFGACWQSLNGLRIVLILRLLTSFFWGTLKAEVYKKKPRFLRELKKAVEAFTQSVTIHTRRRIIENFAVRINACANRNWAHIENVNCKKFGQVIGMLMHMPK